MSVIKIPDHVARSLANLLSQFQGKQIVEDCLSILVSPCQDLEDTLYDLVVLRALDAAEGAQLDQYGVVVGANRRGLSDDDYRRYIRVRIMANRSNGQGDVILDVVSFIVDSEPVEYYLHAPAAYQLQYESPGLTSPLLVLLGEIMEQVTGAGIGYEVVEGLTGEAKRFDTAGRGFDDGKFGSIVITSG